MFGGDKPGQDKFDKLKEVLGWLEKFVADDKFAAGTDCITLGDLALLATYSTMKAAELADVDLSSLPNCEAWFEKCCKLVPNYEKVRKVVVNLNYIIRCISRQMERAQLPSEDFTNQSSKLN